MIMASGAHAQMKWPWKKKADKRTIVADTTKKTAAEDSKTKPYKEIITDKAISKKGLITVHKVKDKWFFQIPDSLMGREMLAVTRFSKTPSGGGFYAGELSGQQSVYFEKGPDAKIFLRVSVLMYQADASQSIFKALKTSTVDPIAAVFEVKTYAPKDSSAVIDVTDFLNGDNPITSLSQDRKQAINLTGIASDRSFIQNISTYPTNTEVRTLKTFMANTSSMNAGSPRSVNIPGGLATGSVTIEMNTSFLLLPKVPMKRRYYDTRVGYFADEVGSFSDSQEKFEMNQFIVRWRLEPKKEDLEKWKRGELVEPAKPIVYYIDPATPRKWVPYLIQGVNDWQKAFEKAGFKNAISAKEWPVADTTMSMEDARFSVIRYFASDNSNAYGPNVHDPRSGEIMESHIGWYHNIVQLLHNWYLVQAGAIDPRARTLHFDDELMGSLIRFVSSHEIGHTLGLTHNFGASSTVPVEKLRDKAWVEAHGHTPSIMDYARFNYVAQPEDGVGPKGIYPRIGDYDEWAIKWGYAYVPGAADEAAEKKYLSRLIVDSVKANPRLWFGSEMQASDPRTQSEDLGDNSMKASAYGIKNLKRIVLALPQWTYEADDQYTNLKDAYTAVRTQYATYLGHVLNNISSSYHNPKTMDQSGDVFYPMSRKKQKEAVNWLGEYLFKEPVWLINPPYIKKLIPNPNFDFYAYANEGLTRMLNGGVFLRLIEFAQNNKDAYTVDEYLTDIETLVYSEIKTGVSISAYRRNIQKSYVQALYQTVFVPMNDLGGSPFVNDEFVINDVASIAKMHLAALQTKLKNAIPKTHDQITRAHLTDMADRIGTILNKRTR